MADTKAYLVTRGNVLDDGSIYVCGMMSEAELELFLGSTHTPTDDPTVRVWEFVGEYESVHTWKKKA